MGPVSSHPSLAAITNANSGGGGRGEVNIWREGDGLLGGGGISISDATHNRFARCLWNGFDASLLSRRTLLHPLTL